MATPMNIEPGHPAGEPADASADLQAVSHAEEKLLKALECSVRVIDQLATIGGADPLQASKDAEQFLLLLKDSHALAASMATKYALTAPVRRDTYVDQLELSSLQSRLTSLQQQLASARDTAMDTTQQ